MLEKTYVQMDIAVETCC